MLKNNAMTPVQLLNEARTQLLEVRAGNGWLAYRAARPGGEQDIEELLQRIEGMLAPGAEAPSQEVASNLFRSAGRYRIIVGEFTSRHATAGY
ncbi:MAG TPA: hypothetical protein VNT60_09800 [Deinococcales bacterium]|nr:hypothetical protein [Deinococcales bacterium]